MTSLDYLSVINSWLSAIFAFLAGVLWLRASLIRLPERVGDGSETIFYRRAPTGEVIEALYPERCVHFAIKDSLTLVQLLCLCRCRYPRRGNTSAEDGALTSGYNF